MSWQREFCLGGVSGLVETGDGVLRSIGKNTSFERTGVSLRLSLLDGTRFATGGDLGTYRDTDELYVISAARAAGAYLVSFFVREVDEWGRPISGWQRLTYEVRDPVLVEQVALDDAVREAE